MVLANKVLVSSTVFITLSLLVNIILAALIVSRLIYRRRHFRNVLGEEHGSPSINTITMCVESSALIVIFSSIYAVLAFTQRRPDAPRPLIPLLLLPHIYVGGRNNIISHIHLRFLGLLGYLATPHRLSDYYGSRYNPNFEAIGANEGPSSVQHSTFQSRRGMIRTFPHSITSTPTQRSQISCQEMIDSQLLS